MSYVFPVLGDYRITSNIGSRSSPGGIGSINHQGIDIAPGIPGASGTVIVAPTDLRITRSAWTGDFGNAIYGTDAAGDTYIFGHLAEANAQTGQYISAGSQLGIMGSTGNSTGTHLHFAVKDAAGNFLADKTKQVLGLAKSKALDTAKKLVDTALKSNPVTAPFAMAADALGANSFGSDSCGIICQIKKWFEETQFWQRLGVVVLALILITAAFYLFGTGQKMKIVQEAAS